MSDDPRVGSSSASLPIDPSNAAADTRSAVQVVAIGASAGGLEASVQLLSQVPADIGVAIVVVQHLGNLEQRQWSDRLSKSTPLPVVEASDGLPVLASHVYVIPPQSIMTIAKGALRIGPRVDRRGPQIIDQFLRSLAVDAGTRAVGVILSGMGSDGTIGLCEVRAAGGLTFVQDEKSAKYADMPRSAIEAGCADFVLPPDEIGRRLQLLGKLALDAEADADEAEHFSRILDEVRIATGVDFRHYRDTTIRRRVERRAMLQSVPSLAEYARLLKEQRDEVTSLYRDLLINVTAFFRDREMFESLKRTVFPEICVGKTLTNPIRIWVAGCSTGQEVYSIAMMLLEYLDDQPVRPSIQIFGTDLSDGVALARARAGSYPESIQAEVSPERLRRFFRKERDHYVVEKSLRDLCVFALHNVAADPPFSQVDLISCRNVLIYMAPVLQRRVIPTMHYALRTPGFLILGGSESIGTFTDLFEQVERPQKVFAKKSLTGHPYGYFAVGGPSLLTLAPRAPGQPARAPVEFHKEAERLLLGRFAPPSVLVNEHFEILQFHGRTGAYLESPPGDPTPNLLKMAREGLSMQLRSALNEAKKQNEPVRRSGIRVQYGGGMHEVSFEVVPVKLPGVSDVAYLVLFEADVPAGAKPATSRDWTSLGRWWRRRGKAAQSMPGDQSAVLETEKNSLRRELSATSEYIQWLVEQHDAATEELRSANEEILSSNEELQSTNEELQTAKEELQSSNEELTTVNEQLQQRNAELTLANDDLANLLGSIAISVLLVGSDLRIRRFTPAAGKVLNLISTDIGRPINTLGAPVKIPQLEEWIVDVIEKGEERQHEVRDQAGRSYMLSLHPYRTAENRVEGAVVVLVDITGLRRGEEAQLRLGAIVESSEDAIIGKTLDGTITTWNRGAERLYGYTAKEVIGLPISILIPAGQPNELPDILDRLRQGERIEHYETVRRRKNGTHVDISVSISPIRHGRGSIIGAAAIARDISQSKAAAALLRFQVEAGIALASLDSPESILQKVGGLAVPFFADCCMVDLAESGGNWRRVAIAHVDSAKIRLLEEVERRYPTPVEADRGPSHVLRTGQPEILSEVPDDLLTAAARDADHLRLLRSLQLRSYISVPLRVRGIVMGVLTFVVGESGRRYTANDLKVAEDLAYRVGIAVENAQLYSQLGEADRRKDEFLAILAHELRNPLAPVRSAVEVLRLKSPPDRDLTAARDIIDRQTRQMTRIVDDLLDISRITQGRIELRKERVLLSTVVESAVESSRPLIDEGRHELTISLPPEPVWLEADQTRLAQVLLNLLNNAAKFTPAAGRISLIATREAGSAKSPGHISITVRDNGIGIPDEQMNRIFEIFAQGDRSLERSKGGLGVGLTLVRSLVQMHDGTVEARSAGLEQGSEFVVRLPMARERKAERGPQAKEAGDPAAVVPRRILVVDDNRDQAESMATLLQMWGHDVRIVHDGHVAVAEAKSFIPDMALVDIGLPGMSGYDVAREIRSHPALERVVLVAETGWGQEEYRKRSQAAGFDHHLVKPVAIETLQNLIASLSDGEAS